MSFLLDTHTLIWMMEGDARLSKSVSEVILDKGNELWISKASFWEISIKRSLGKLKLAHETSQFWETALKEEIQLLNIEISHLMQLEKLPMHHKDPFDRIIISQAICEGMILLSKDEKFTPYDVRLIWE